MLPWWSDTLTVFHKAEEETEDRKTTVWTKEICENCFWRETNKRIGDDRNISFVSSRIVRLPKSAKGLKAGNIVVRGVISDEIPKGDSGRELVEKYGKHAFIVSIAKDNTGANLPLPHYYGGE